ncbi:MAG TPA: ANTAR domain-containing protein [Candidatus Saccharimonadales bacterium]|nr:ANTAR domain-containing protein [Candidatus Saccharimonadales bacterium]
MKKNSTTEILIYDIINLLYQLVVFKQYNFNEFLERFIKVILKIISADSCLIYFYDLDTKKFILIGSKKPHDTEVGTIKIEEGEGITGWVAQHKQSVAIEKEAYKDPRFKTFKELPEDTYESFLSVPIIDETGIVGVINIQNRLPYVFSSEQIKTIESLVKIIASAFVKIVLERKVNSLEAKLEERKKLEKAKGILMRVKGINEDEAFKFIRRESMNKRKTMLEIAEAILLVM